MKEVVTHDRFSDDRRAWRPGASLPVRRTDTDDHPAFVHRVHADGVPRLVSRPYRAGRPHPVRPCRAGGAVLAAFADPLCLRSCYAGTG